MDPGSDYLDLDKERIWKNILFLFTLQKTCSLVQLMGPGAIPSIPYVLMHESEFAPGNTKTI